MADISTGFGLNKLLHRDISADSSPSSHPCSLFLGGLLPLWDSIILPLMSHHAKPATVASTSHFLTPWPCHIYSDPRHKGFELLWACIHTHFATCPGCVPASLSSSTVLQGACWRVCFTACWSNTFFPSTKKVLLQPAGVFGSNIPPAEVILWYVSMRSCCLCDLSGGCSVMQALWLQNANDMRPAASHSSHSFGNSGDFHAAKPAFASATTL